MLRTLNEADRAQLDALIRRDPVTHCFVASRMRESDAWSHGDMWGWFNGDVLVSAAHYGANLVPIATSPDAREAIIHRAGMMHRRCSSFVGPADEVLDLWAGLAPAWGPAREIRESQPLLLVDRPPAVEPDPRVVPVRADQIDVLLPAAVAMFTEEVGVSPLSGGSVGPYRARVLDLVRNGRALARIEDGRVVFKAEIGAVANGVCQVQGVWVAPERRGEGLSIGGMAAVVAYARDVVAPQVSLYVNDFNDAARSAYRRVGFEQVGVFATILF